MENNISTEKRSIKLLIIGIIVILVLIVLGTYAWLSYRSSNTAVYLRIGEVDGMSVSLHPYQVTASLVPTNDYSTQQYSSVTVTNKKSTAESFKLSYYVDSIDSALIDDGFKYTVVKTTDDWTTQTVVKTGDFSSAYSGGEVEVYTESVPGNNTTYKYKVYLWIDSTDGNQASMQGKVYEGSLQAEITTCYEPSTIPALQNGMIPVTIANDGTVTVVNPGDSNWYSYCDKKWANVVLVKYNGAGEQNSHSRSYYQEASANSTPNVTVTPGDILAYLVWIPRYSYKVWQYSGVADTVHEREIKIRFDDVNVTDTATGSGQYYTHPAFNFGDRDIDGFWVGKFESVPSPANNTGSCYDTPNASDCLDTKALILPNVDSLRYQNISDQFNAALWFSGRYVSGSTFGIAFVNEYGLSVAEDSHVMKNSEWGAVAYLAHSRYGINGSIRRNNYQESGNNYYRTLTGCGASAANANNNTTVTTCAIPYGTVSGEANTYPQSTTGNISGVFDMAGGAYERVLGHLGTTDSDWHYSPSWLADSNLNICFDIYDSNVFTGTSSTNFTFCTLASCGGHALNETRMWYSNFGGFVDSDYKWFERGGSAGSGATAGIFTVDNDIGDSSEYVSFRVVIVPDYHDPNNVIEK